MTDLDLIDDYSVLVLEESYTLQDLFADWLDGIEVRPVADPDAVIGAFDATVAVACLSETAFDGRGEAIRNDLLSRNPYCQLVGILSRSASLAEHEPEYDECLQRPILKVDLQDTVERRLAYGIYSSVLREFYDLNAAFVWRRRDETDDRADAGSADRAAGNAIEGQDVAGAVDDGNLEELTDDEIRERYQRVCRQLDALQGRLSGAAIAEITRSIRRHKDYLTTPNTEVDRGPPAKHHPRRCPACKLPWGIAHGNELGNGFIRIAAGVRRCTRCQEIVHGLGESGRRITSR
ncbi:hypothetical protein GWK26_00515 [haloarchaeon 3A1-DGR]|nr:hypothetical protein GWK26_00515 [haloarchaeon 3A1-DGR]